MPASTDGKPTSSPHEAPSPVASTVVRDSAVNTTAETPRRSETSVGAASGTAGTPARSVVLQPPGGTPKEVLFGDGLDADAVRQYRLALATQARRFKRYPSQALEAGIGGTVEIRVAVAADGQAGDVALARSSGQDLLDAAAFDMMQKAAPRTPVPELLRGRTFAVSLPVVFDPAE